MSVVRAFIAIDLSTEIRIRLDHVIAHMKSSMQDTPLRWTPAGNIHLTMKFLGDVSVSNLEILKKILQAESARHHQFEISVGQVGAFPSIHRPRVVWAGVEAPAELAAVQSGIENELARLGYAREEREFSPHLTLGRVSRNATPLEIRGIGDRLGKVKVGYLGATAVKEIHLYKSDLRPEGSQYTRLFSAPLGA
jgi:2'-5' RNA ligase